MPIEIINDGKRIAQRFRTMGNRVQDVTPTTWRRVGAYISSMEKRQFDSNGAALGTPWKPLKPEYLQWKIKRKLHTNILDATGAMRKDFTGRPMKIERYEKTTAVFGTDDIKAVWHQKGTKRNGKQINPARPIMKTTPEMAEKIGHILADYIVGRRSKR